MPMIQIGADDVLRSKIVKPEWYEATIKSCNMEENAKKDANNFVTDFRLTGGEFDGVVIRVWFSEKAIGFIIPMYAAVTGKPVEPKGFSFDSDKLPGKKLQVHVINEQYNSRLQNAIDGYRPSKASPPVVTP